MINIVLRLLFYMTGIFYNVETRLAKFAPWNKVILHGNPTGTASDFCQKMYDLRPDTGKKVPASVDGAEFHPVSDRSKDYL